MNRERLGTAMVGLVAGLVGLVWAATAVAAEFTADSVRTGGGRTVSGKVMVKGKKYRMETEIVQANRTMIVIVDAEAKKSYILQPDRKAYSEIMAGQGFLTDEGQANEEMAKMGEWKKVGAEKIAGYDCEKRVFIYKDKAMGELTQWFATKLQYPVKTHYKGQHGESLTELKNIKEGGVADALFAIPGDYVKIDRPPMGPETRPGPGPKK